MTKEQYYDMCEQLGTEPVAEEVPVDIEDLPLEAQECLNLYKLLRDEWEFVGGNYLGKNLTTLFSLLESAGVPFEDQKVYYEIITIIDNVRIELSRKQQKPAKET